MRYYKVEVLKQLRNRHGDMMQPGTTYVVPENIARAGASAGLLKILEEVPGDSDPAPHDPAPVTTTTPVDLDGDGEADINVHTTVDVDPID